VDGSCDEDEGRKVTQEGFGMINKENNGWMAQRKADRCSGQGC
jgi:hypothetical protein